MDLEFLTKSLPLQLAIGGGYIGYMTAYAGIRGHHQQTDIAFLTIAFGLVATLAAYLLTPLITAYFPNIGFSYKTASQLQNGVVIVLSVFSAVAAGVLWRAKGRDAVRQVMRRNKVSYADDDPSVWTSVFADREHNVSQVSVILDDGRELFCDDTSKFANSAVGSFVLGGDGSIGIYATHSFRRGADGVQIEKIESGVQDDFWGDMMSVIPAGKVEQVNIRFQRKGVSYPASGVEAS